MIEQFGLWTYNDGWQVLLLVCVMLVAAGILMGILWNTKGLADELSGRKRQRELEYLRHRFAEMNVRSLDEVNVADPLSHVGESAPMPLTPAGGVFTPQGAAQPLGAGEVLNVGGVEVSQQQVAAIKSELLGDDDEPVTGFFTDGGKTEGEDEKGEETEVQKVEAEVEAQAEDKAQAETEAGKVEKAKAKVEESKSTPAPVSSNAPAPAAQQGIQPVSVDFTAAQGIQPVENVTKSAAEGTVEAPAESTVKASSAAFTSPALLRIQANAEKAFGSEENEEAVQPEQSTGILAPAEDDESDATPTGIFTPVKEDKKSKSEDANPVESADSDSSEGITAHLTTEPADDDEGVTTTFAPAGSSSAYRMKGAQFVGELISTGSYDPKTGETKLESPSGVDKATTGFLND